MLGIFDPHMDNLLVLVSHLVYVFTPALPLLLLLLLINQSRSSPPHSLTLVMPRFTSTHLSGQLNDLTAQVLTISV